MFRVRRSQVGLVLIVLGLLLAPAHAKYKIKDLQLKAAAEYKAHQEFQGVVIGAYPCDTIPKTLEIFDTEELTRRRIVPVLLVVENNNMFPIRVRGSEIFLVESSGEQQTPILWVDALLEISLKKPLSGFSGKKELLLERSVKKEMYLDFEHKAFDEKLIPPGGSDFGVIFFRFPDSGSLKNTSLYLPEVVDVTTEKSLMFFEFPLQP